MPYREKSAWLSLIAMAVTYGPYFTMAALAPPTAALPDLSRLGVFAATSLSHMTIILIGRLYFLARSPEEARAPADERDQAIERRSNTTAYYLLMAGLIVVGVIMPFTSGGWIIVNAALATIVGVEILRDGLIVLGYRRGLA